MTTQASYQSGRLEKGMRHYIKETMNEIWYHLLDKQVAVNQDQRSKLSKMMYTVEKLTGKPVDDYIKTFTGDDVYIPPMPVEEMAVLLKAMPSDGRKHYEEVEISLMRRDKSEETYASATDFVWDYTAVSHQGQGAQGNWKIQERSYNRKGDVTGTVEVYANYDQYWKSKRQ